MDFSDVIFIIYIILIAIVFVNLMVNGCPDCYNLNHCESYQVGSECSCCTCKPYLETMVHISGRYYYSSTTKFVYIREGKPMIFGKVVINRSSFEQVFDEDGTALTYDEYLEKINQGGK